MSQYYEQSDALILDPPKTFIKKLKFLGPGLILSASIVGSGELIATTTLGAEAGFSMFWIIIVSCLVKVAIQLEFGKRTILYGETAAQSFNLLKGRRFGKGSWALWILFLLVSFKVVQLGGMMGGMAVVLNLLVPGISIYLWVAMIIVFASSLVYKGYYNVVEKGALGMILLFTVATLIALFLLGSTPYAISTTDILEGFKFKLPKENIAIAFGAFGLTGVAADEIIAYTYWCVEKGYAAYVGPRNKSKEWHDRAKGWVNVMYLDAFVAMLVYTLVTAAFYLLGAAILQGVEIPRGNAIIETLAGIYTETLGPNVRTIYLIGAAFVLFSSVFTTLAFWTRLFPDMFGQLGWFNFSDESKRKKLLAVLAWLFPVLWGLAYFFINLPVAMIIFGGLVGSALLFLIVYSAIIFKRQREVFFKTSKLYGVVFWISAISILLVGAYGIIRLF